MLSRYLLQKSIVLLFVTAGLVGCTRPSEDSSTVKIQIPSMTTLGSSSLVNSQKLIDDGGNWGQPDPVTISEIGCWGVLVKTADSNGGTCSIGSGASFRTIQFSQKAGLVENGGTLQVDVKPGQTTFSVVGFKKGSASCSSVENLDSSNLSSPFVLGETTKDIAAGNDTVSINASLNAANLDASRIGNCSFMGAKSFSTLSFMGPTSKGAGSSYDLNLLNGTCGKYYLRLSTGDGGDGGAINTAARTLNLTYGAHSVTPGWTTVPLFYSDATCSTPIANNGTLSIPAGENSVEVYAKGAGSSWTAGDTGSKPFTISDASGELQPLTGTFQIRQFSGYSEKINFFLGAMSISPGTGREVEYFFTGNFSGTEYYVPRVGGTTVSMKKLDLSSSISIPSSSSGFGSDATSGMRSSSATTPSPSSSQGFASTYFRVDSTWTTSLDMALVTSTAGSSPLFVNVQPLVPKFTLTSSAANVFASDCVQVSANTFDAAGSPMSFYGSDSQGIGKKLPMMLSLYGASGQGAVYASSDCSAAPVSKIDWTPGANEHSKNFSVVVGSSDSSSLLRMNAYPFFKSEGESPQIATSPHWDPSQLGHLVLRKWWKPWHFDANGPILPAYFSYAPFTSGNINFFNHFNANYGGVVSLSSSAVEASPSVGPQTDLKDNSRKSVTLVSGVPGQNINTTTSSVNLISKFLVAALVKIDPATMGGTSRSMISFANDPNTPTLLGAVQIPTSTGTLTTATTLGGSSTGTVTLDNATKWYVVFARRNQSNTLSVALNLGSFNTGATVTGTVDRIYFGAMSGYSPFAGEVGEVVIADTSGFADDAAADVVRTKLYSYFKARYSGTIAGGQLP